MVTAKQVILYVIALPQPPLIQTKFTYEQLKKTSKSDTIITTHNLKTENRRMTPPPRNTFGK